MKRLSLAIIILLACAGAQAISEEKMTMNLITSQGVGQVIGTVTIAEAAKGLGFTPDLEALPPGERGFHAYINSSYQPTIKDGKASTAESAGGHYDPHQTGKREGPEDAGHMGDLPLLVVDNDDNVTTSVVTPWPKTLDEVKGKTLMIHVGDSNMSDQPKPSGDGGAHYTCGVIK